MPAASERAAALAARGLKSARDRYAEDVVMAPNAPSMPRRSSVDYELSCPCDCDCASLGDCLDLDDARWPDPAHPERGWEALPS